MHSFKTKTALPYNDMSLDVSHNFVQSDEFSFGPNTAMAFDHIGSLYVTNGNNLLTSPWQGGYVEPVFEGSIAPSPFQELSGVTIDRPGNLYVSDSQLGTITMLPRHTYLPGLGLASFDDIAKKKLTVLQGKNRPSQIQLAPDEAGLVFFDAEGFSAVNFGMSGQIAGPAGNPLGGAKIFTSDSENKRSIIIIMIFCKACFTTIRTTPHMINSVFGCITNSGQQSHCHVIVVFVPDVFSHGHEVPLLGRP